MNEELQKQLSEVVRKSLELAEKSGKFVMDQAPELLNEFYRWKIFDSIFNIIISIGIFLLVRYLPLFWLDSKEPEYDKWATFKPVIFFKKFGRESGFFAWGVFMIGIIVSFIMMASSLYTILFIAISPKMYLINYFFK